MSHSLVTPLIEKYNIPAPRYTSYPTVPYWEENTFAPTAWTESVRRADISDGISVYIHLPFCESLCTFCGCNKRITKNHEVEGPYIETLLKEWGMYLSILPHAPAIKEVHLGGGTPTFFTPSNLKKLINGLMDKLPVHPNAEFSFEGHPGNTTRGHLQALYDVGFRRVSYGIQCFDPKVQIAINRRQTFEAVLEVTQNARDIGYTSVNYDVIYGLPFQNEASIHHTFEKLILLKPDRVAYYSYAHVPWIKGNGQRKFTESDLPSAEQKLNLYALGESLLSKAGYKLIGMDHFGLPTDSLYTSSQSGQLHRNFMGYTAGKTELMIGLGVSAISDAGSAFAQNHKSVDEYMDSIANAILPVFRGHILTDEDLTIRKHILDLMCRFETKLPSDYILRSNVIERLIEPMQDELVFIAGDTMYITESGRSFLRNICLAFDERLWRNKPESQLFSMTV